MASFARLQWVIRKQVERGRTRTTITPLDESDRVAELAAMLRDDSAAEGTRQETLSMLLEHKLPDDEHAVPFERPPATVPIQEIVMPMLVDLDEPRRSEIPPCVPEPGVRPFVWGVWGLLTVTAFGFVARYGTNVPTWDDYHIVGPLIGARPVTLDWLWEQC